MIYNDKWVKLITENGIINLQDRGGFSFVGFEKHEVNGESEIKEFNSIDGGMPTTTRFAAFELTLNFRYIGKDKTDLQLFCFELEQTIQKRTPYYVIHSDMPGLKFEVLPTPKVDSKPFGYKYSNIAITFTVFKGYAESLKTTDEYSTISDTWQIGNNLIFDSDISFNHSKRKFQIYNGSSDIIDPVHRHKLLITMNLNAPNGFTLKNKTTGDTFTYNKELKNTDSLVLNGVYPYKNKKHCGIDTNLEYITLEKGYNDFEVLGDGLEIKEIKFTFNFIYR